jgi:hypothetical protein
MGDDPRCKNKSAWTVLVPIDPTMWFDVKKLASSSSSGVRLSSLGMMVVRWSSERVCIDAIDVGVEMRTSYEWRFDNHLVVRWLPVGKKRRGGMLLHEGTRRRMDCNLAAR